MGWSSTPERWFTVLQPSLIASCQQFAQQRGSFSGIRRSIVGVVWDACALRRPMKYVPLILIRRVFFLCLFKNGPFFFFSPLLRAVEDSAPLQNIFCIYNRRRHQ